MAKGRIAQIVCQGSSGDDGAEIKERKIFFRGQDNVAKLLLLPACPTNVLHWRLLNCASAGCGRNPAPEADEPVFYPVTF